MKRPAHIWIAFGLCFAILLAVMGWLSHTTLKLEQAQIETQQQAEIEENVRLALWRMDSSLAPLIARESARPYFAYAAFYPADRAYDRMFKAPAPGNTQIPSPLLTHESPDVLLHFQVEPGGQISSPQVPRGQVREETLACCTTPERIRSAEDRLSTLQGIIEPQQLRQACETPATLAYASEPLEISWAASPRQTQRDTKQKKKGAVELTRRAKQVWANLEQQELGPPVQGLEPAGVAEGIFRPLWEEGELLLVRQVTVHGQPYIQGAWLNWPQIKQNLLRDVEDLFPSADLVPARSTAPLEDPSRLLAALPLEFVPGDSPVVPARTTSPIRISLFVAWGCVLVAAAAVAALLKGTLALSERRGAFVSAVTHELRTPLTTFRMYTEMLDEGMVQDEEKKKGYFTKLRREADRLGHLVENVLSYARLEGSRCAVATEDVSLQHLLARTEDRLSERAQQSGMELIVEDVSTVDGLRIRADLSAVEQVLFNLVDNACKYASTASDRRIHLESQRCRGVVTIRIRDHGPGISKKDAGRLFRPFSKSDRDVANSAPGVGLGLALCRRLAREMGGDLKLDPNAKKGACFVLTLPAS